MPMLNVQIMQGYSSAQKTDLLKKLTQSVVDSVSAPLSSVRVVLQEIPPEHVIVAGEIGHEMVMITVGLIHGRTDELKSALIAAMAKAVEAAPANREQRHRKAQRGGEERRLEREGEQIAAGTKAVEREIERDGCGMVDPRCRKHQLARHQPGFAVCQPPVVEQVRLEHQHHREGCGVLPILGIRLVGGREADPVGKLAVVAIACEVSGVSISDSSPGPSPA